MEGRQRDESADQSKRKIVPSNKSLVLEALEKKLPEGSYWVLPYAHCVVILHMHHTLDIKPKVLDPTTWADSTWEDPRYMV